MSGAAGHGRSVGFGAMLLVTLLALAGCDRSETPEDRGLRIACRAAGERVFEPNCTVERSQIADGTVLTLRHVDGHFRRLLVMKDGRGVTAADGAEEAVIRMAGDRQIEVRLGSDAYMLPAKVERR